MTLSQLLKHIFQHVVLTFKSFPETAAFIMLEIQENVGKNIFWWKNKRNMREMETLYT